MRSSNVALGLNASKTVRSIPMTRDSNMRRRLIKTPKPKTGWEERDGTSNMGTDMTYSCMKHKRLNRTLRAVYIGYVIKLISFLNIDYVFCE
jgi:hypothetical protein